MAAAGKETTRQKMINFMYLVLLAMLALNVSETILDAFKTINDSLTASAGNVGNSIQQLFTTFEQTRLRESPERAKPIYEKAKQAEKVTRDLDDFIMDIKRELTNQSNGVDETTGDLKDRDNLDIGYNVMINKKRAKALKEKIKDTREKLKEILGKDDSRLVSFTLNADDPVKHSGNIRTWEELNFGEGVPLTATFTILSKIQADNKNAESEVVKKILGKMDQAVVNLDKFEAVAVAPTSYLIQGQPYKAQVFLTAYDSKSDPVMQVGGTPINVSDGRGEYTVGTSREGIFKWQGTINVKQTDGTIKTYTTPEQQYMVARPSAVVSPDKMNVFYIGVDNPVSVSVPGIPSKNIRIGMSSGILTGSSGKYIAKVSTPGTVTVTVSAEVSPGKTQVLSSTQFRAKRIPDPIARFSGKSGGSVPTVALKAQDAIYATLDNFDFDARFHITRFSLIIANPRETASVQMGSGNSLSSEMHESLNGIKPGSRVIFDNIIAVGPDGSPRQLAPVALTAN
ncbi:gliding motility protein GldM [Mucilaginibacter sp. BJC16-A38]|uniref:type IX secretion system motor protein PorM/GldM n=1 Tax=Mucilaginibacter phenanthrenivorans TaxID=1234842 RepID=UPI0021584E27|nr:gliding motility protein GldM [Mucilaginibacter phenanthrenivorans]MCR8559609.1 gliding motility protein GldM [Mucilaginibacter phenanthrenivorans]